MRLFLTFVISLVFTSLAFATHNRAGEIIVEMIPDENGNCGLRVRATIITYTKTSAFNADRDSLELMWGDGSSEFVHRTNGPGLQGEPLENDIKYNTYVATHTYGGIGHYTIGFIDPNRNAGVLNVNFPLSVNIPFYIENSFTLTNAAFAGCNNSPVLSVPPIDVACLGEVFTHNPGAFDPDGDHLEYILATPQQGPHDPVPNFLHPAGMTIDQLTGDLVWPSPNEAGEYNIAIHIISFRNGNPIDTMIRDMQIIVEDCENNPPEIVTVDEICVIAGETINFDVIASAPIEDTDEQVRLIGYGTPFTITDPATLTPPSTDYFDDPLVKTFNWQTNCEHISNEPYNVVFRAVDNFFGDTLGLAFLKTVRIKVVGPPPEDVQAEATGEEVRIDWKLPYTCEDVERVHFRGFSVWKRLNSDQTPFDPCVTGLEGRGYTKLTSTPIQEQEDGRYFYVDNDVEKGRTYCYRVLAEYAHPTAAPNIFFNPFESLPSEEVCVQLARDVPLLIKVDVDNTDSSNGVIDVCWSKPIGTDLDTILNAPPYTYELLRANGHNEDPSQFSIIHTATANSFATANDTCFTDTGLNTVDLPYTYWVKFYVNGGELLENNIKAGSIYLNAMPTDRTNVLSWDEFVPWENYEYTIFRENDLGVLDSIASTTDPVYRDEGLVNGQEYCYVVRASGTYNIDGVVSPLVNRSQRLCSTPIDNVPPCPPILMVSNLCDQGLDCEDLSELENTLEWEMPGGDCALFEDVDAYRIYYTPQAGQAFSAIGTIDDPDILSYIHRPELGLAGCYAITAIDTVGNESALSDTICVDNCPFYELPNAFTPNSDNQNDLFRPTRSCFIASVEFKVFNRWGGLVFETTDAELNWNGEDMNNKELGGGTYYYTCKVFENRVDGITTSAEVLSGYIELIRDAN